MARAKKESTDKQAVVPDFEKLGVFYLGRPYDLAAKKPKDGLLLYDSKDLVTHAVCVGMTGSGKTGLCVGLLEEAAIAGIPALVVDPKGDLANLMLTFPQLRAEDFAAWVNEDDARKKGMSAKDYAAQQAEFWKNGLAGWKQDGGRIKRLKEAAEVAIYTPGSRFAGVVRGFQVRAVRGASGTDEAAEVKITVGHAIGSATVIPTQVTITRHRALDGPEQPTGDPAFDARFHVSGDAAAVTALLDAGTREALLRHAGDDFEPVILRQATVFGPSPRMRFDLVVNAFVKDALVRQRLILHGGGRMWRPLISVNDLADAHVACVEAPGELVAGETFNM